MPRRYIDRRAEQEIEALLQRGELAKRQANDRSDQKPKQRANATGGARPADGWQSLIEQRIQDAMERGLFDNLKGMGAPLNLDDDRFVPEDMKLAFRMLRSTGLAPLWVELNKEIREDLARLIRFREHVHARGDAVNPIERDHLRKDYVSRIKMINEKIVNYNILAPSSQVHLPALIEADELARFDEQPPLDWIESD